MSLPVQKQPKPALVCCDCGSNRVAMEQPKIEVNKPVVVVDTCKDCGCADVEVHFYETDPIQMIKQCQKCRSRNILEAPKKAVVNTCKNCGCTVIEYGQYETCPPRDYKMCTKCGSYDVVLK